MALWGHPYSWFHYGMNIVKILLTVVGVLVLAVLVFGWRRTYKTEHGQNQEKFRGGTADMTMLDGDYEGVVTGYDGTWQGKTIFQAENRGINRFKQGDSVVQKYPFATYVGKGLRDRELDVIKLDYNQRGNPWWLQFIVDEMVKVGPDTYLGKVHIHLAPGLTFSMGYFTLER